MKLPTNAQIAEIKSVAGMNTDVAIMTGRTNMRRRKTWAYATRALRNVNMVSRGTVCSSVVYGSETLRPSSSRVLPEKNNSRMEKKTHTETPVHQNMVQCESLNFRRLRVICRGSGKENTSMGRVVPSLGSSDSVSDKEIGSRVREGGGGRGRGLAERLGMDLGDIIVGPGEPRDEDEREGEGERILRGGDA